MSERRNLVNVGLPGYPPEMGRWLWALEDTRRRTKQAVEGIAQATLDWQGGGNGIGSLLYHIAAVELDWLYADTLAQEFPGNFRDWFPHDVRDQAERLVVVVGESLEHHLKRLDWVQGLLLEAFKKMSLEEFRRPKTLSDPERQVSPEWVLYHLIRHEATHQGQILMLRTQMKAV